jgi:arsenate reductase (thioredoxin)
MTPRHFNVLFLCTGNSARSVMAEAIMNRKGFPNFTGYSAGSHPTGHINPEAIHQIAGAAMTTVELRSKSWDEFGRPDAPEMHFVFTVCDSAAAEVCPVWPGHPYIAKWSVPDPAAVQGTPEQVRRAFFEAFTILDRRITLFLSLPLATLEREIVQREIDKIGRS